MIVTCPPLAGVIRAGRVRNRVVPGLPVRSVRPGASSEKAPKARLSVACSGMSPAAGVPRIGQLPPRDRADPLKVTRLAPVKVASRSKTPLTPSRLS